MVRRAHENIKVVTDCTRSAECGHVAADWLGHADLRLALLPNLRLRRASMLVAPSLL